MPRTTASARGGCLGGVVVDHVEDDLDAGGVQRPDHRPELLDLLAVVGHRRVRVVRREEPDRVVAPVVAQAPVDQVVVVDELVHRHQFERGDPEPAQVLDHGRVLDPGVRAAQFGRDVRVPPGQALDVRLVDDRLVVRHRAGGRCPSRRTD
jgi:hypothetical protein